MGTFEVNVNAMVTIYESEHFTITANSAEEAKEKQKSSLSFVCGRSMDMPTTTK